MLADPDLDIRVVARSAGTVMPYAAGDVVFCEGDPPRFMYVVLSGSVEIAHGGRVIETIGAGKALGILSLLDEQPRSITATAREPGEIAVIEARRFCFLVEEVPGFAWYVMAELARRLRSTNAAL